MKALTFEKAVMHEGSLDMTGSDEVQMTPTAVVLLVLEMYPLFLYSEAVFFLPSHCVEVMSQEAPSISRRKTTKNTTT